MARPTIDPETLNAVLTAEALSRVSGGPEPEPEEVLDYLEGRLPPVAAARLERQLVASPAAARMLLDLEELAQAQPPKGDDAPQLAVQAGWRELRTGLPGTAPRTRERQQLPWVIAASLLLASVGLGAWVWTLELEKHRPVANLASLELAAGLRAAAESTVELPPGAPLRLVLAPADRCAVYAAALTGPGERDHYAINGLERDAMGRVTLLLHGEPGHYTLRLFGCEPRRELEEHRFEIRLPVGAQRDGG